MMADAKAVKWSAFAIIALVACAGAFLLSDSADNSDAASSGTAGDLTWTLDDSGGLIISGTGAMPDYQPNSAPWGTTVTSVSLSAGITHIGNNAFSGCTSLTSVTIPDSVTTIGAMAFSGCKSLTSITIPDSVTTIGVSAFESSGLTSITIPDSVTKIDANTFRGCAALASVTIPDSVTTIGAYAFRNCAALTSSVVFADYAYIGASAFSGCKSLTSITIPDSVTLSTDDPFQSLIFASSDGTSLDHTTANLAGAMWLRLSTSGPLTRMISSDGSLTWTLDDSGGLTISGTGAMLDFTDDVHAPWYGDRTSIKTVSIADGVTTIGAYAFNGCTSLTSITIPDSVTKIGDSAFSGLSFASSDGTAVEPTAANLAGAIWTRDSLSDPFIAHVWIHIHDDADISGTSASILQVVIVLTLVAIVLWMAVDVLRKRDD